MAGSGRNRMPLVHIDDAARALVHLARLGDKRVASRSFVVADGSQATMAEFLDHAAQLLGARKPPSVPMNIVRLFAGKILAETLTRDLSVDPVALKQSGFAFRYPSYREGLPPTLSALGDQIGRRSRAWTVAILGVLAVGALIAVNCVDFSFGVRALRRLGGGEAIPDMRLHYSASSVYHLFDRLGPAGRAAYLKLLWLVDSILPLLFGGFLALAIGRGRFKRWRRLPLAACAFDYLENLTITWLLLRYPSQEAEVVVLASAFTLAKHTLYASGVLLAVVGWTRLRLWWPCVRP
jgi:hypothetical protein